MKIIKKVMKKFYIAFLAVTYYIILPVSFLFYFFEKNIWLIGERGDEAKDNGYYFYKYLKKYHPEVKVKYVITKKSSDLNLISRKDIVYYRSLKHFLYFINSKYLISTHYIGVSPHFKLFSLLRDKGLIYFHGKFVFLQHGIIYNYLENVANRKIDLFITSSLKEREFVIDNFNYSSNVVRCTGLSRYDYFDNETKKYILVMPTWRRWIKKNDKDSFRLSEYFQKWNEIINSEILNEILKQHGINILFYPHYEVQKYIDCFDKNDNVIMANSDEYYIHDLLNDCLMFITDFSSTSFDVAYLHKPVIYYQFDYEKFYDKHYKEGYMSFKNDGFGPVVNSEKDMIEIVSSILNNDFKLDDIYEHRINEFFAYNDRNNCERIYNEINKINNRGNFNEK